jgi:uncharacterized Fe-S cluster-containing radical SAM superfamily enzyme
MNMFGWPKNGGGRRTPSDTVLCDYFDQEIVILSDGGLTTCVIDNKGQNRFANIYKHDFQEAIRLHLETKRKFVLDAAQTPACLTCVTYWKERPHMYKRPEAIDPFVTMPFRSDRFAVEVTSRCNVRCKACIHHEMANDLSSVRSGGNGFLDLNKTTEWLRPMWGKLKGLRMYNYGEPFLHKGLEDFCADIKQKSPGVVIGISTNGTSFGTDKRINKIIDSKIDGIVVSLHGGTAELSRRYLGEDFQFEKAIDNVRRLMAAKRSRGAVKPTVNLKCVLFEWNDSEEAMTKFADLADELGTDIYHFVPTGGDIGTKRLPPGSKAWADFAASGRARVQRTGQGAVRFVEADAA